MPVALIVDEVTKAIENDRKALGLYLDLKKAFDTVNVTILIDKLYHIWVRGDMLKMITSYFTNRTQQVEVNGHVSELRKTSLGVPQGSILGLLFFILYVNDLSSISNLVKFFQFADDTAIVIEGDSYDSIQAKINTLIPKLTSWFSCNKLSLNPC